MSILKQYINGQWIPVVVGEQGPKGDTGDTGPQGIQGPKGDKGDTGDTGPQGIQGIQGIQGPQGDPGPAGADGQSAYEVAVANGFVGTEAQWLASLVGPKGDKGDTGDTGPQGIQGEQGIQGPKGDTGDQGPQGIQGEQGPQGIQGIQGETGATGPAGPGVAVGGTAGQVLSKIDGTDYNTEWVTPVSNLDSLTDVVITTAAADNVLTFNGTNWVNNIRATRAASVSITRDDATDATRYMLFASTAGSAGGDTYLSPRADAGLTYNPLTGKITTLGLGTDSVSYNTAATIASPVAGQVYWNSVDGTLNARLLNNVTLQVGQETHYYVKASGAITNGQVVMFAGAQGDHLLATVADASQVGFLGRYVMGVATQDIANGDFGYVTHFGKVNDINTSAWAAGSILYLNPSVPGALTATEPTAPNPRIVVAAVARSHAVVGNILVRPDYNYKISQLSDVQISNIQSGEVIKWNSTTSRWENGTVSTVGALNDLTDVVINSPTANQILKFDGTNWINSTGGAGGASSLDELTDVAISSAASGQILKYNGTEWINSNDTGSLYISDTPPADTGLLWVSSEDGADVVGIPNSGTAGQILTKTSNTDYDVEWADAPISFSGSYNDLTDKPTIPTGLDTLVDVDATGAADGQYLRFNGTSWINSALSGDGSGITNLNQLNAPLVTTGTRFLVTVGAANTSSSIGVSSNLSFAPSTGLLTTSIVKATIRGSNRISGTYGIPLATRDLTLGGYDFDLETTAGGIQPTYNIVTDVFAAPNFSGNGALLTDVKNLKGYNVGSKYALSFSSTLTPDVANGNIQEVTLTDNVTFSAFSNPVAGQELTLIVKQDATGGRTLTSTMLFANGSKTLSTAPNAIDIIKVTYDGSTYYASLTTSYA